MSKDKSVRDLIELALWDYKITNLEVDDVVKAFNAVKGMNKFVFVKFMKMQREVSECTKIRKESYI